MSLIDRLLSVTVKQRRAGSYAAYALARKVVAAYQNHDVDIRANGEAWLIERMARVPGLVALDVGANRGEWSAALLDACPSARLVAYEAVPATCELLRAELTGRKVEIVNAALSDAPGTLTMQAHADVPELASLHADYSAHGNVATVAIEARTGDDELARLGIARAHLLKVDTEGHDYAVLAGFGGALVQERVDVIQFEYNYTTLIAGRSLKAFYDLLAPAYLICRLLPHRLEALAYHPMLDDFTQTNFVALRRDMLDADAVRHFAIRKPHGLLLKVLEQELAADPQLQALLALA